jgi:hypothetical protein
MKGMRRTLVGFVAALGLLSAMVGAQAPVMPYVAPTFQDNTGAPANGMKFCSFLAGTTTPQVTYSDSALSVPNPNPIVLNAAGRPSVSGVEVGIYPPAVNMKYILYTAASTTLDCVTGTLAPLWTRDNVESINQLLLSTTLASGTPDNTTFLRGDSGGRTWARPWTVLTVGTNGTINNFAPGIVGPTVIKMNNASLTTITGMTGTLYDGCLVEIEANGTGQVDLANLNAGSTGVNQLINAVSSANTSLAAGAGGSGPTGGVALYRYDGNQFKWRLVSHDQGAWITPTFVAGQYTAAAGGTWTVSGAPATMAYWLKGRTLLVTFVIIASTVAQAAGNPTQLQINQAQYGGFTPAKTSFPIITVNDNGTGNVAGTVVLAPAATTMLIQKITAVQWANSTTNTNVFGSIEFEVQ